MSDDRTPRSCPLCGFPAVFDGCGSFTRSFERWTADSREWDDVTEEWYQFHCTECDGHFAVREAAVESQEVPADD